MKIIVRCLLVPALCASIYGVALGQAGEWSKPADQSGTEQTPLRTRRVTALPDGEQPVIATSKSGTRPRQRFDHEWPDTESSIPGTPIWERLSRFTLSEKENALIQLEVSHDLPRPLLGQVREIEELWNTGQFDQAITRLRDLVEEQNLPGMAVGISWKVPIVSFGPKWGTDVQISTQGHMSTPSLDSEDGTGNLFAVLQRGAATHVGWTTNISTDGGATWQQTYTWSGDAMKDVSASVIDTFLYVAYAAADAHGTTDARIRRFFTRDGVVDAVYYYKVVFDKDIRIKDVALTTDEDALPGWPPQIYYLAILLDRTLVYCYSLDGLTWYEVATGVTDAYKGLDACFQAENWFLWASYLDSLRTVYVARRHSAVGWESIALEDAGGISDHTSVAAYENRIMVVYEYADHDIRYQVSYDGGDEWFWGWVAQSAEEPPLFRQPHVTGRRGGGFAVVYEHYEIEPPDTCWFMNRDYGTGPGAALWSVPQPFNEVDVLYGQPMVVEWIPPLHPACHAYGSIWIGEVGIDYNAYFDRIDRLPGDTNGDEIVDLADPILVLNYLFRGGPAPIPLWTGDANCDGTVELGDAVHILNYLFRGGPPPCC